MNGMDRRSSKHRVSWDGQINLAEQLKEPGLDTKKELLSSVSSQNGLHSSGPYLHDLELPRINPRRHRASRLARTIDAATIPYNPTFFRPHPAIPSVDTVCLPSTPPILSQRYGCIPCIEDATLPFVRPDDSSDESDTFTNHILISYEAPETDDTCLDSLCVHPNMRQPTVEMYCGEPLRPCTARSAPSIDSVTLPVAERSIKKRIPFRSKSARV